MRMYDVAVFQQGAKLTIVQSQVDGTLSEIDLAPERVPTFCKWLMESVGSTTQGVENEATQAAQNQG